MEDPNTTSQKIIRKNNGNKLNFTIFKILHILNWTYVSFVIKNVGFKVDPKMAVLVTMS